MKKEVHAFCLNMQIYLRERKCKTSGIISEFTKPGNFPPQLSAEIDYFS
jgi:hypothetical protein